MPPKGSAAEHLQAAINGFAVTLRTKRIFVGRKEEGKKIDDFLDRVVRGTVGRCMYVSGNPGTGKTYVISQLLDKRKETIQAVWLNGVSLLKPESIYRAIILKLWNECPSHRWDRLQDNLWNKFISARDDVNSVLHKKLCLVVLDEADFFLNSRQKVVAQRAKSAIYTLLDWASDDSIQFAIVMISNEIGLLENALEARALSRAGTAAVTFQEYTVEGLTCILQNRAKQFMDIIEPDALSMTARLVAKVHGDARVALTQVQDALRTTRPTKKKKLRQQDVRDCHQSSKGYQLMKRLITGYLTEFDCKVLYYALQVNRKQAQERSDDPLATLSELFRSLSQSIEMDGANSCEYKLLYRRESFLSSIQSLQEFGFVALDYAHPPALISKKSAGNEALVRAMREEMNRPLGSCTRFIICLTPAEMQHANDILTTL